MNTATTSSAASRSAPDRIIQRAVLVLSLAAFGSGISQRVTDALLPVLTKEFSLPLATVSWVITCFTMGYALCQLFFGPVGDRYGKYRVIAWACVACSVAALLCAVAPDLWNLLLARALAGAMTAGIIPLAMAWIGDVVPYEHRQPVLARFLVGQILGVAAGQLLGGLSADYLGRRAPFLLLTVLFATSAALLFAMRRKLPADALRTRAVKGHPVRHMIQEFHAVLKVRWARVVLLCVCVEGALMFGPFAFFATHLHEQLLISLTAAGAILMCFGLGGLLFATVARGLVSRLGEVGLARGGGIIMLAAFLLIGLAPGSLLVIMAALALGLGFYMLHNTLQTNATQMAPERRGAAVSAFALSFFIGQSCGVALAGWAVTRFGTRTVVFAAAVALLLMALNFARQKRQQVVAL
jgi:predicted MFS family arabinose efflux permease